MFENDEYPTTAEMDKVADFMFDTMRVSGLSWVSTKDNFLFNGWFYTFPANLCLTLISNVSNAGAKVVAVLPDVFIAEADGVLVTVASVYRDGAGFSQVTFTVKK